MKIMHVVTRWQRAGTERNVACSLRHEADAGHEVLLVVGGESYLEPGLEAPVTVVAALQRAVDPRQDLRALAQLRHLIQAWQPDVVHTHQSKAGILGRAAASGVPCVVHTVHMASFGPGYGPSGQVFLAAERLAARRTDVLVCVGEDLADLLASRGVVGRAPGHVVRSPVDVERFSRHRSNPEARAQFRALFDWPAVGPILVAAGALEPRKRHDLAIQAIAPILRGDPTARFLVAGSGPRAAELSTLAKRLGVGDQVELIGQRDDLDLVFAAADLLVHTAAIEGVPQVVVQALAGGLPIVMVEVEGADELARRAPYALRRTKAEAGELERVIREVLAQPSPPVSLAALDEWTGPAVDQQRTALLQVVAGIVGKPAQVAADAPRSVSVIVPTHGRPVQLARALTSIAAQTSPPDEVVVVDDLDDPATAEVVALAAGPVRRVVSPSRDGAAASRNLGLRETTGDVVAFLDDDDVWAPTFLQRTCQALHTHDVAVTWTESFAGEIRFEGTSMPSGLRVNDVVAVNPGFTGSNAVYRRAALDQVGGFDPGLRVSNDKDLLVRLLEAGCTYAVVPERLTLRDVGDHDRLGSGVEARLAGLAKYLAKHDERMSPAQRRYLRGRMERVRRRRATAGSERLMSTVKMALLLGPSGVLQVRLDDRRSTRRRRSDDAPN